MENMNTVRMPVINEVQGFNPADYTRTIQNDDGTSSLYLDVKYRLLWFRLHRPAGKIKSEIIRLDDKSAVVSCTLYADRNDPADQYIAKACAQRFLSDEKYGDRYLEIAETAALGRVLAQAGYGTQFCGTADMLNSVIADAPVEVAGDTAEFTHPSPAPFGQTEPQSVSYGAYGTAQITEQPRAYRKAESMTQTPPAVPGNTGGQPEQAGEPATLDSLLNTMTLQDAENVVVDVGRYKGMKLGDILMRNPRDLAWYADHYAGRNLNLKAGSILLMRAATRQVG